MGKKREEDPGLKYLMKINFNRARGKHALEDRWQRDFGKTRTNELYDIYTSLKIGSKEFYEFKNSDYSLSKSFSEVFDGDIIRKACNYVASHKEYFGETILDVGCDIGYITGFLALTFPDSRIISIDRSPNAVKYAKDFVDKLGVTNVEFRNCDLEEVEEQFDTVFCARTIQENINSDDMPFDGEPIRFQFARYAAMTENYTKTLMRHVKPEGSLFIFERLGHDPLLCGWLLELNNNECAFLKDTYQEFKCEEVSKTSTFQGFICIPGNTMLVSEICEFWFAALDLDPTRVGMIEGWQALVYTDKNAGELIRGIYILDRGEKVGRFVAFYDKDDPSLIYYLAVSSGNEMRVYAYSADNKEEILQHMEETIRVNKAHGMTFREYNPEEDLWEGV